MHEQVFLGLGSNLGDSIQLLKDAVENLSMNEKVQLIALSSFYQSAPMGPQEQPDYINAVCQIYTSYSPNELLTLCQNIENDCGRDRSSEQRWGPRPLDLDILLFDDQKITTPRLTIPHSGMAEREFVLVPLFELEPSLIMPDGQPIAKWVAISLRRIWPT